MYGIKGSLGCEFEKIFFFGLGSLGILGCRCCRPMSYGLYLAFLDIMKFILFNLLDINPG
jgi:hypothetical protein